MRLTYGPFERIGSQVAIKRTRLQFLWNAKASKPEITTDLYKNCYPLYQEFLAHPHTVSRRAYDVVGGSPGWNLVISSKESKELLHRLKDWSENYHLVGEWPIQAAVTAMKAWSSDDEALHFLSWCKEPAIIRFLLFPQFYPHVKLPVEELRQLRWMVHQLGIVDFGPDDELCLFEPNLGRSGRRGSKISSNDQPPDIWQPPLNLPLWWFASTSREEYLSDVEKLAREALESTLLACVSPSHRNQFVREVIRVATGYCDRIEASLSSREDWKRTKVFVGHRAHMKRVIWAVRFQIEGKSYTEIAKEMNDEINYEPSVATVKRGVDEVLDIIRLDVDRRSEVKRGPKLGSTQSCETKSSSATLRALGH